jgi:hypothetical protein
LTSRIAYGPPIYSDRSTFTADLVILALFSIILIPMAFFPLPFACGLLEEMRGAVQARARAL